MIFPFDFRKPLLGALMAFLPVAAAAQTLAPAPEASTGRTAKTAGEATKYMVAAANPLAAEAGREMLRAGGSAVDAAIAVQLVLNLVEPQSSGIGGGAFMVHWDAGARELATIDGRETAPAAAKPERFLGPDGKPMEFMDAVVGGRSVGVPGTAAAARSGAQEMGQAALGAAVRARDPARRGRLRRLAAPQRAARQGELRCGRTRARGPTSSRRTAARSRSAPC